MECMAAIHFDRSGSQPARQWCDRLLKIDPGHTTAAERSTSIKLLCDRSATRSNDVTTWYVELIATASAFRFGSNGC